MRMLRWLVLAIACLVFVTKPAEAVSQKVLAQWIYDRAQELPRSATLKGEPETEEARAERIRILANSLAPEVLAVARGDGWTAYQLAAAILTLWNEETRLDHRIHAGLPHPVWTSDYGRAKCLGQVHSSQLVPPDEWAKLAGTDETSSTQCARATIKMWLAHARNCQLWRTRATQYAVAATYAAYGSGGHCKPDERAHHRAIEWAKMMRKAPKDEPIPGFRRLVPGDIPQEVHAEATRVLEGVKSGEHKSGKVVSLEYGGKKYALLVERHAAGKVGVSVLRHD